MDFVTLTMPCVCTQGSTPGVVRDTHGKPVRCPACGGATTVPIRCRRQPFDYSFPFFQTNDNAAGSTTLELQLDDDAYFEFESLANFGGTNGGNLQCFLQLSDLSNGWQFSNAPIAMSDSMMQSNFAGPAASPAPLLVPYIIRPSSVLQLALTWIEDAIPAVQLALKGYKLYPLDQDSADALGSGKAAA